MDKINRPPVQCTVIRNDEPGPEPREPLTYLPLVSVDGGMGESIPTAIKAHIDKVSKMRIFEDNELENSRE